MLTLVSSLSEIVLPALEILGRCRLLPQRLTLDLHDRARYSPPRKGIPRSPHGDPQMPERRTRWALFFCSSAGEYEQARPLMDRLSQQGLDPFVVFFSVSGPRFLQGRCDPTAFICAPSDSTRRWREIFTRLMPEIVIINRHELWPAFISVARSFAPLVAVNVTAHPSRHAAPSAFTRGLGPFLRRGMLGSFDWVFVVSDADRRWARRPTHPRPEVLVVGDTKYDRARERVFTRVTAVANEPDLEAVRGWAGDRQVAVLGSAWPEDLAVLLASWPKTRKDWALIVVPHDVSTEQTAAMQQSITRAGLSVESLSHLAHTGGTPQPPAQVLIVDRIGILTEVYARATCAIVGGGFRGQVHNVLEPLFAGIQTAAGPGISCSHEAGLLAERGVLAVVRQASELSEWMDRGMSLSKDLVLAERARRQEILDELCGASDRIVQVLKTQVLTRGRIAETNHHQRWPT